MGEGLNIAALKRETFLKGFSVSEDEIEKAKTGVYADTPENRKLNRVGQKYGVEKKDDKPAAKPKQKVEVDENGNKKPITKTLEEHASTTDTETLKKVLGKKGAKEELVSAAKKELDKRGVDVEKKSDMGMSKEQHAANIKNLNEAIEKLSGVETDEAKESLKDLIAQRNEQEQEILKFE